MDQKKYMNDVGKKNKENRDIWLKKTLITIEDGKSILDVGAGELQYKKFCEHLNYVSHDFGEYNGKGNAEGLQSGSWDNSKLDLVSDISSIPVDDDSFDALMCIEVLEHVSNPISAIREFFRILKPGGKLILTAPFCSLTHMAPYYYVNGYSKYWYEKFLKETGFMIEELQYNGNYFEYLAQEIRRIPDIEKKYTGLNISNKFIARAAVRIILKLLEKLSKNNNSSEKLLCFGLHILAVKIK